MKPLFYLLVCIVFFSCVRRIDVVNKDNKGYGYVPIYASKTSLTKIGFAAPKTTVIAGKIYAYGNYIFQNDVGTGIHIIDNTNKQNPIKISFIEIPYSSEVALKDSILYANNLTDLVVFDLSNPQNPKLINRIQNVFPDFSKKYPTEQEVYFECVDTTKGEIVGWKKQTLTNANCYR